MTRRPIFWIVLGALGLAGAVTALQLFTVALPNVSVEIAMDREAAMAEAAALADRLAWGPEGARSAASFGQVDSEVQTYVELEGGGRDAFQGLMDAGVYQPYQWEVRRFAEGEVAETSVSFSPAGTPYGFRLRLAEDDAGPGNLTPPEAQFAAAQAVAAWPLDLTPYDLLESSSETLPGGRVDHTFVYERDDITLADARFRLRLVVSGNRLSQLTHFVFVPEAFSRRYADMRSTNDAIALVSQSIFLLLYVLLGAGVGSALLLRRRWIEWRTAFAWGAVTATLFGLNAINALPLSWMSYDTAVSANLFIFQNIASAGAIAILGAPILAFFFLAGESLGRKAFPDHLQQWRFWSPEVAASNSALGITVGAYLFVGLQVGYVVLFYMGTSRLEGWWSPADALVQPDLLATYFPWLQAVSTSLFAALWEESIFRAVPIACAALIGARYGRRNMWVWGMVAFQAVVFAAGHANYPQQPAYARVVELSIPAFAWGSVYVFFGLVPTILAHFLYDLALISSVLFASDAMVDQGVIVGVAAIPLIVVLWARRGGRGTSAAPVWSFNRAWSPAPLQVAVSASTSESKAESTGASFDQTAVLSGGQADGELANELEGGATGVAPEEAAAGLPFSVGVFATAGAVGFALWVGALLMGEAPPKLSVTRGEAVQIAQAAILEQSFTLDGWTPSAFTGDGGSSGHEYVFEEAGEEEYQALFGEFLPPPQWIVRFVDWNASPEERVEEFLVNISGDGTVRRVVHQLPEGRAGAVLEEASARALARRALPPGTWEDVSAEESAHESRTDWDFTFRDPSVLSEVAGEGRASIMVNGDEVGNVRRFVHVPEEWARAQRDAASRRSVISLGLMFVLVLMFGVGAVVAIVVWSRRGLEPRPLWIASSVAFAALAFSMANAWPATTSVFSTAQPFGFQAGGAAFGLLLVTLIGAPAIGLVIALGHSWAQPRSRVATPFVVGPSIGLLIAGAGSLIGEVSGGVPGLPDYDAAAELVPMLSVPLDAVVPLLFLTGAMLLLAVATQRFRGHPFLGSVTGFAIVALGAVLVPSALQDSPVIWVASAFVAAAGMWALTRLIGNRPALAPMIFGTMMVLSAVEALLAGAYPGSTPGQLLAIMVIAGLAWRWSKELGRPEISALGR